jgi:hypothetical protein
MRRISEDDPDEEQIFRDLWEDETQREIVIESLKADCEIGTGRWLLSSCRERNHATSPLAEATTTFAAEAVIRSSIWRYVPLVCRVARPYRVVTRSRIIALRSTVDARPASLEQRVRDTTRPRARPVSYLPLKLSTS